MASNDTVGVKVTEACQALGIQVPQEAAVTGVDNEDVLCELANPTLSSVPCDCERIGYEAAAILDGLMSGRAVPPPPVRVAPRPLVVRASSDMLATDDEAVKTALRFIRTHADLSINVSEVLRAVPLCRRSLEIRFRKALGHTLHDEIRRTRLQRACRLLDETSLPVAKIALLSGFSSHQRFHTVFRRELGQAPAAYRKRLRTPRHG
jgi:LacI family transcriptional regulator